MGSEIRRVIERSIVVQNDLRDQQIKLQGTPVVFIIPKDGSEFDEFGDQYVAMPDDPYTEKLETQIVIDFGDYEAVLAEYLHSKELTLPVKALAKLCDNIPKGSTTYLTFSTKDGHNFTKQFVVNGLEEKLERFNHSKILILGPTRK